MIIKERDTTQTSDKRLEAGQRAEKQMAFYLRRAFGEDPQVAVLHDLRLERKDQQGNSDAAQMDHVIVHSGGVILVESKSVTTTVVCNDQGHWTRITGRGSSGMPSPIIQVREQGAFLRTYMAGTWPRMSPAWRPSFLVAISDEGQIRYVGAGAEIDSAKRIVYKADQIADRVRSICSETPRLPTTEWEPIAIARLLASHHRSLHGRPFVDAQSLEAMVAKEIFTSLMSDMFDLDDRPKRRRRRHSSWFD